MKPLLKKLLLGVGLWMILSLFLILGTFYSIAGSINPPTNKFMSWVAFAACIIVGFLVLKPIADMYNFIAGTYNDLTAARNEIEQAWQDVEVQLRRKSDLVPRITEIAERFLLHEHTTLRDTIQARNSLLAAGDRSERLRIDSELRISLGHLFTIVEAYPNIVSSSNVSTLHVEITVTENQIANLRTHLNSAVSRYNEFVDLFPSNLVARHFCFERLSEPPTNT